MPKGFFVETYGCQMNFSESEALSQKIEEMGWRLTRGPEEADLVILQTCTVRGSATQRVKGRLGFYRRQKSDRKFTLVLAGCLAQGFGHILRGEFPEIDVIVGTRGQNDFLTALAANELRRGRDYFSDKEYQFAKRHYRESGFQAMTPIMHGCANFCAYCIVPYVRGADVSRPLSEIIGELQALEANGVREVTLLGQSVNQYHYRLSEKVYDFADLLKIVLKETGIPWLRFLSPHPAFFTPQLVEVYCSEKRLCRHLHLPAQHGSDNILRQMNRRYSKASYLRLVETLRLGKKSLSLSADLMVGFPGETEEDLKELFDLVDRAGFEDSFTYYFNPMPGTAAEKMKNQLPVEEKKDRLRRLINNARQTAWQRKQKRIGSTCLCLIDRKAKKGGNRMLAKNEENHRVLLPENCGGPGDFVKARLIKLEGATYSGEPVYDS